MNTIPFAMLISGGGTTATAIWEASKRGEIPGIDLRLVIASRPDAHGILRLGDNGFPTRNITVVERRFYTSRNAFGTSIEAVFMMYGITHFGQYGWLPYTPENICRRFFGINQHPGPLDPVRGNAYGFGGRGMHGRAVHAAVLAYTRPRGMGWTEATAHRVSATVDGGDLLGYEVVEILPKDDVETLAARVLPVEHQLQIRILQQLARGDLRPIRRSTPIVRNHADMDVLAACKEFAVKCFPNG